MKYLVFILLAVTCFGCKRSNNYTIVEAPVKETKADSLSKFGIYASSQNDIKAIQIGRWAPDFKTTNASGDRMHLRQMLKDGPVVLVFYRGYWCSYCIKYLTAFEAELEKIKETNARIIAIAPEIDANQVKTIEQTKADIMFISDPELKIMDLYDLAFKVTDQYNDKILKHKGESLEAINGQEEAYLPIPATYVIGTDGKVKWSHFDPNYKNRPDVEEILNVLKALRGN